MVDVEKLHLIQGTVSKFLDVISVSPEKYKFLVSDPDACQKIAEPRTDLSITSMDGKGEDGRRLFPSEHSFQINR